MRNNLYRSTYRDTYKNSAHKNISELVQDGIKFARTLTIDDDFADKQTNNWLEYSQKMIELSTSDLDPAIHLNYLRLLLSLQGNFGMTSYQKISTCLEYLLEVLKIINEQY